MSLAASSKSISVLNCISILLVPFKEFESMFLIPSAPQILKQAAGFTTTMWVGLSSPTWNDLDLGDYAERYLEVLLLEAQKKQIYQK